MRPRRAVLVDDERLARIELRRLLADRDDVEVVGEAADAASARALLAERRVDLAFLDIRLGEATGFDVLDEAPDDLDVVFVTAHAEHAVRAFEVDAVDYLLKPVDPARLAEALGRLDRPSGTSDPERANDAWAEDDWLALPDGRSMEFVQIRSILSITAEADYTRVRTEDGSARLVHRTMREWERRLPDSTFLRIHRSALVNLHRVARVEEWSRYTYRVHLEGVEEPLPMSRRYASRARARLG